VQGLDVLRLVKQTTIKNFWMSENSTGSNSQTSAFYILHSHELTIALTLENFWQLKASKRGSFPIFSTCLTLMSPEPLGAVVRI
jgi:hypothetical protein